MKLCRVAPVFLLTSLLLGCRPERMQVTPIHPRTVVFGRAGISLVVGEDWECRDVATEHSLRPPTLVSRAGTIRVLLLPPDRSDPVTIADVLRADFDESRRVARHSFRKELFTSDSGVRGLCVSYLERADADSRETYVENSHFLVKNGAGRCVAINYLAAAEPTSAYAVRHMLQTSLSLQ